MSETSVVVDGWSVPSDLVVVLDSRCGLTELTVQEHFGPDLRRWVGENCERHPMMDVWLLPVADDSATPAKEP